MKKFFILAALIALACNGTASVIVVDSSYPTASFGEPPDYTSLGISRIVQVCEENSAGFVGGSTDIIGNSSYGENGDRTVFYGAAENLWRCEDWEVRTGNAINLNTQGVENALQIYMRRFNTNAGQTNSRLRKCEVIYYGINGLPNSSGPKQFHDSDTLETGTLRAVNNEDLRDCIEGGFTFDRLSNFGMGSVGTLGGGWGSRGMHTAGVRPLGYWFAGLVYWEMHGNAAYVELSQSEEAMPWAVAMAVNHLYRFRHEWYNSFANTVPPGDTGAPFQIHITISSLLLYYEWSLSEGLDPDRHVPDVGASAAISQLVSGDYFTADTDHTLVTNPYSNTSPTTHTLLNIVVDTLQWAYGGIDYFQWSGGEPTSPALDTRAPPTTNAGADLDPPVAYMRVLMEHDADNAQANQPADVVTRARGYPMLRVFDNGEIDSLGRTGCETPDCIVTATNGGQEANNYNNLQMMQVADLWCTAKALNDLQVAAGIRDDLIRWGRGLWKGAVNYTPERASQRGRNQHLDYLFNALDCYNSILGTNY